MFYLRFEIKAERQEIFRVSVQLKKHAFRPINGRVLQMLHHNVFLHLPASRGGD